ncbi:hypothetical protein HZU75_06520 [Chitinibacter fontanus]|uniref:Uncharacterized protein n=1 Tax=Chitinibacter fontanus TaxID=1737446 RepID=A0A7D5V9L5_9NEIS|nr:hypothetical protein [Chitinibacter fontanus]QLI81212.1 hypothetical protein HZU75_06520 [Chitinibacter fontanus]
MSNPNKIWASFTIVRELSLALKDGKYSLFLTLSEDVDTYSKTEIFQFDYVSQLNLSNFGGGASQFCLLQVSESNNGLDRARYYVEDVENENVSFYCESFTEVNHGTN